MPEVSTDIAVELKDLLRFEYLVFQRKLLPKKQVHSILAGKNVSKLRGRGLDFEEVRKYVNGDDIRNIDWKVTARTRVTHTKVFTEEKERPVFTVVDQTASMFFGSRKYTKSVIAAHLAAISAFRTLKVGDRFGGLIFDDKEETYVAPKRSRAAVLRFLEQVVFYNRKLLTRKRLNSTVSRLNDVLRKTYATVTHDYVITVMSDFVHTDDETKKLLINLARHNDVILVAVSDTFEQSIPNRRMLFSDGDLQVNWKAIQEEKDQLERLIEQKDGFLKEMRKYGVLYMQISTDRPVEDQLKEVLNR